MRQAGNAATKTDKSAGKAMRVKKSALIKKELHEHGALYLLALPGVIALVLFSYMPMAGLVMVFKSYNYADGIFGSPWVGLRNFRFFFADMANAFRATTNTIILNVCYIVIGTVFSVAMAIMMNEIRHKHVRKITQSVMFFPFFISWVALGSIFHLFLDNNGIFNDILAVFSIEPVSWYVEPDRWRPIMVFAHLLKTTGYNSIIYFAALTGFDPQYYEAAQIDGASRMRQIWSITIPLLRPTIIILFLLSIGKILNGDLNMVMGLTSLNPLLLPTTDIIESYVYRSVLRNGQFEMASAITLYQSIFGFVLVLFSNWLVGRFDKDYKLF